MQSNESNTLVTLLNEEYQLRLTFYFYRKFQNRFELDVTLTFVRANTGDLIKPIDSGHANKTARGTRWLFQFRPPSSGHSEYNEKNDRPVQI